LKFLGAFLFLHFYMCLIMKIFCLHFLRSSGKKRRFFRFPKGMKSTHKSMKHFYLSRKILFHTLNTHFIPCVSPFIPWVSFSHLVSLFHTSCFCFIPKVYFSYHCYFFIP
jgi:hypothetical protein